MLLPAIAWPQAAQLPMFFNSNSASTSAAGTIKGYIGQPIIATSTNATRGTIRTGYIVTRAQFLSRPLSAPNRPAELVYEFALQQNYPNPFNPSTVIPFSLDRAGDATLALFNVLGQNVRSFDFPAAQPGSYSITWDGRTQQGAALPSGQYFARLSQDARVQVRKLTLLK